MVETDRRSITKATLSLHSDLAAHFHGDQVPNCRKANVVTCRLPKRMLKHKDQREIQHRLRILGYANVIGRKDNNLLGRDVREFERHPHYINGIVRLDGDGS